MTIAFHPTDYLPTSLPWSDDSTAAEDGLANFLGWFSIGLGLAEVTAPLALKRLTGLDTSPTLLRAFGLREMASGVGILTSRKRAGWLWSRVAGDALDLVVLGSALARATDANRARVAAATVAVAGVTALDIICAGQLSRDGR